MLPSCCAITFRHGEKENTTKRRTGLILLAVRRSDRHYGQVISEREGVNRWTMITRTERCVHAGPQLFHQEDEDKKYFTADDRSLYTPFPFECLSLV